MENHTHKNLNETLITTDAAANLVFNELNFKGALPQSYVDMISVEFKQKIPTMLQRARTEAQKRSKSKEVTTDFVAPIPQSGNPFLTRDELLEKCRELEFSTSDRFQAYCVVQMVKTLGSGVFRRKVFSRLLKSFSDKDYTSLSKNVLKSSVKYTQLER